MKLAWPCWRCPELRSGGAEVGEAGASARAFSDRLRRERRRSDATRPRRSRATRVLVALGLLGVLWLSLRAGLGYALMIGPFLAQVLRDWPRAPCTGRVGDRPGPRSRRASRGGRDQTRRRLGGVQRHVGRRPQVAGVAALVREVRPGLPPAQVGELLRAGARDVTAGAGCMGHEASPGTDLATGAGLVDAGRSLARARRLPAGRSIPPARPAVSAVVVLRTPDTAAAERPAAHDVDAARAFFGTAGFEVTDVYGISFSITGRPTVFEATFGETITTEGTGPADAVTTASGRLELRLDRLPEPVTRAVAAVTFSPPPAFGPTRY